MPQFFYLSDIWPNLERPGGNASEIIRSDYSFTRDEVFAADYIFVVGQLTQSHPARAAQIAGVLREAVRRGSVVVVAYELALDGSLQVLVERLVALDSIHRLDVAVPATAASPEWTEYFETFASSSGTYFGAPTATPIGVVSYDDVRYRTALWTERGEGAVYVVPAALVGFFDEFLPTLFRAVSDHRAATSERPPEYLAALRLPGEDGVLAEVADAEVRLADARARAAGLERFRLLVGPRSGQALEDLVIDALNVVLEGTAHHAEDRPDTGGEDFWVVEGEREVAFAEVKGVNRSIGRQDVGRTDAHRDNLGHDADQIPSLLIVNTFRNSDDLTDKQRPVPTHAIRRGALANVLILRSWDLYKLVSRRYAGHDVGREFLDALAAGGGWLEVRDDGVEVVKT